MSLGDSKTPVVVPVWQAALVELLRVNAGVRFTFYSGGVAGSTVATAASSIGAILAAAPATGVEEVLCNWGANDAGALPAEATWKANYTTILDAINARWPAAKVRLTKPWRRGYAAACDSMATWLDAVVAARSAFAYVADDERGWLENGDDGVTRTTDGVHYNSVGNTVKAAQMRTAMGF